MSKAGETGQNIIITIIIQGGFDRCTQSPLWRETYTTRTKRTRKKPQKTNQKKSINFPLIQKNEGEDNLTLPETCRSEAAIYEGARSQCDGSARERRGRNPDKKKKKKTWWCLHLFPSPLSCPLVPPFTSRLSLTLLPKGQTTPAPTSRSDLHTQTQLA